jgi:serine/threonine protein kinase
MARQECVIQSQMKHENIAQLKYFAESPTTIELILEYCDNHSYFEDRLEEVSYISRILF